jgi:alanine-synthesizing transaminase
VWKFWLSEWSFGERLVGLGPSCGADWWRSKTKGLIVDAPSFSSRTSVDLRPNRLARALERLRAEGRPFIDLTESNPTRAGFDYPAHLLAPLADPRGLSYAPQPFGAIDARRAVAREYARQGLTVPPEHVVLTASTSDSYSLLFKLLADQGDEVLVPRPSYPLFDHLTRLDLVVPRAYDLDYHGVWSVDFVSLERAWTPRTRAVLVVSPNNPTGSFLKAGECDRLVAMCADRGVAIIADEVFADYELEEGAAAAAGRSVGRDAALSFSLGGLSKSVGLPQVKLGWIVLAGPAPLVAAALERLELICDTYLAVSTPVQLAASELLDTGAAVRSQVAQRIAANYRRLREGVSGSPSCNLLRAEGGWYAVLQVPSLGAEEDLVIDLLTSDGVLVQPGYFFDFRRESFLILSLLTPDAAFSEGIGRLTRHFGLHDGLP